MNDQVRFSNLQAIGIATLDPQTGLCSLSKEYVQAPDKMIFHAQERFRRPMVDWTKVMAQLKQLDPDCEKRLVDYQECLERTMPMRVVTPKKQTRGRVTLTMDDLMAQIAGLKARVAWLEARVPPPPNYYSPLIATIDIGPKELDAWLWDANQVPDTRPDPSLLRRLDGKQ